MTVELISPDWPSPPGILAGTTTRDGGASRDRYSSLNLGLHVGDDPKTVEENRQRFADSASLPSDPVWLSQTHSCNVAVDSPASKDQGTDALVTRLAGRVAVVMTADCLPVVFAARDGSEIGIAHAGWRGLCGGILERTVATMVTEAGSIIAWLGPAISQPAFEVGPEVREQFIGHDSGSEVHFLENSRGRYQADLCGLARLRLRRAGVIDIYGGGFCTYADSDRFFSYRRDGQCGRFATFIYR